MGHNMNINHLIKADLPSNVPPVQGTSQTTGRKRANSVANEAIKNVVETLQRGSPGLSSAVSLQAPLMEHMTPEQLAQRDGVLWKCESHKDGIFTYSLREQYDDVTAKKLSESSEEYESRIDVAEMNAASSLQNKPLELSGGNLGFLLYRNPTPSVSRLSSVDPAYLGLLNRLGYKIEYSSEGVKLELPSKNELVKRWVVLRGEYPQLPPLNIFTGAGIASDREFVTAYMESDVNLSEGHEFVHDHLVHVIPTMMMMLDATYSPGKKYHGLKKDVNEAIGGVVKLIDDGFKKIEDALRESRGDAESLTKILQYRERVYIIPGLLADVVSAQSNSWLVALLVDEIKSGRFINSTSSFPFYEIYKGRYEQATDIPYLKAMHPFDIWRNLEKIDAEGVEALNFKKRKKEDK